MTGQTWRVAPRRGHAELVRAAVLCAGLGLCVLAVYATTQALLAGHRVDPWLWLGATALVAVVVPVARPPLERLADRLAYGRDGDPRAVMAGFVQRLSEELAVDDVLPQLARTAAQALHSPRSEVRLWLADGGEWRQAWPPGADGEAAEVSLPLRHSGEDVGRLDLAAPQSRAQDRAQNGAQDQTQGRAQSRLRDDGRRVLEQLTGSAGLALSNVRLTVELRRRLAQATDLAEQIRRSRQRLVQARDEQRDRFTSLMEHAVLSRLSSVEEHLTAAAGGDHDRLRAAQDEASAALDALREIAGGIFPPVLEQRGLAGALTWHLDRGSAPASVQVLGPLAGQMGPDGTDSRPDRHPAALEAAAYFSCVALVDECSPAGHVSITIDGSADRLVLRLACPAAPSAGVLQLVRDRVEALGGRVVEREVQMQTVELQGVGTRVGEGAAAGRHLAVEVALELPAAGVVAP